MHRTTLPLLLLLLPLACIGNDEVQGALDAYCTASLTAHSCDVQADCCTGFACVNKLCVQVMPGVCLTDGGTFATGATCGCSHDCASNLCSSSTCK